MIGPWLSGEKVNLRPVRDPDLSRRTEWLNDAETVKLFAGSAPIRVYETTDAQRWRYNLEADSTAVVWAVETKDHRHIGDVDLHNIDSHAGFAKLTILLGDKTVWSRGYGTDTIKALLRHAFESMELEAVSLRVFDFNRRAIRCYEKCGFEVVGSGPASSGLTAGPPGVDEIYMTVTRDNFLAEREYAAAVHA